MSDTLPHRTATRGWLVPIGGALADPAIFEQFVALCGGAGARVVVVPVASRLPRTGHEYAEALRRHGAGTATVLDVRTRTDSEHPEAIDALVRADGVFFTGGDQVRLAEVLGGTPIARVLRRRWAKDALAVAGTSAGASYLSERMIARGWSGPRPRTGMVTLITGLGLADGLVIDQHFRERRRQGRLISAVAIDPALVGLGVDENTAAFIAPDGTLTVVGAGAVTIVDAREARRVTPRVARAVGPSDGGPSPDAQPAPERRRSARAVRAIAPPVVDVATVRVDLVDAGASVALGADVIAPALSALTPRP